MNDSNAMRRDIRENEEWLRAESPEPAAPDTDRLKLVAQIALQEQWLAGRMRDECPSDLSARLTQAARAALAERRSQLGRSRASLRRLLLPIAAGLAAAAAIGLFWFFDVPSAQPGAERGIIFAAFNAHELDDFDTQLETLKEDVFDLELSLGGLPVLAEEDESFEDLWDRMDSLRWDDTADDDWS